MILPAFTLNQLRIFLAVAHSQSLTRAAKLELRNRAPELALPPRRSLAEKGFGAEAHRR